jgi:hypothetical protein
MRRDPTVPLACFVLLWMLFVAGCASVQMPEKRAWIMRIEGQSNGPALPAGSMVLVLPARAADVQMNSFVVYLRKDGVKTCHPVIGWSAFCRGWLIVQGANRATNPRPDAEFVTDKNLLGVAKPLNR